MDVQGAGLSSLEEAVGVGLNPAELVRNLAGDPAEHRGGVRLLDTLPNGNLLFTRDLDEKTLAEIEASPAAGFNIVRFETRSSSGGFRRYEAEWRQMGDRWYMSRLVRRSIASTSPPVKEEVCLAEVELDPRERAETFSFGALEPIDGQRLIDRRRGPKVRLRMTTRVRTVKGLTPEQLLARPARVTEELLARHAPAGGP